MIKTSLLDILAVLAGGSVYRNREFSALMPMEAQSCIHQSQQSPRLQNKNISSSKKPSKLDTLYEFG